MDFVFTQKKLATFFLWMIGAGPLSPKAFLLVSCGYNNNICTLPAKPSRFSSSPPVC